MKLLIVTQTLDSKHSVLGFFVRWVLEFAKQCEQVTVFCLDKGEDIFPENVSVIHIPRTWSGIKTWPLMLPYQAFVQRKKYSHVFVHMNPEYVLSAGIVWKLLQKKIYLWYAHGAVSLRLKVATMFTKRVFSSTQQGFRYVTKKLSIVGQGIDLGMYQNIDLTRPYKTPLSIVSIGRVSASKRIELLLETILILKNKYKINTDCILIGGPVTDLDIVYTEKLKSYIKENNLVNVLWKGPVPLSEAIQILNQTDIFVHFGNTGSLDKAILDAMACGVIPMSSNVSVAKILTDISDGMLIIHNPEEAARAISKLVTHNSGDITNMRTVSRKYVESNFSLKTLVGSIINKIT